MESVRAVQQQDRFLQEVRSSVGDGNSREFIIDENDLVRFSGRFCVFQNSEVKLDILREVYNTFYTVYSGEINMYRDLK